MPQRLTLALEWFLNPDHVPLLVGLEKGWFAEEGLELELVEPKEHFDAFAAMEKGEVDVAITEPIHLVQDAAKGETLIGFARFLHTNGGVMAKGEITRPRELAGCRLQYPGAPGPGGPAIVRTMIEADGGPTNAPIEPVNHGFLHTDAIAEGKADAATLVFYNFEVVEARHRGMEVSFFALKDHGVPDFCQLILVAPPSTLHTRRPALEALVRVMRRGIDFLQQEPEAAREIYLRRAGVDPEDALMSAIWTATVGCFTHDLSMSFDYYRGLGAWLVKSGQCEARALPAPEMLWTNALAL
ncbi:MAG: ABC transporter substrate-binding protein [Alphaproteobacteria bacterium]|nr:ABC transporter substrate-binding protein [Alphaproteobacteria bacterium]